jgi:hypothetical protein
MRKSTAGLLLCFATLAALASTPALAQVAMPPPQKHACTSPGEHPGRLASDSQRRSWERSAKAYLDCLKKFVEDQKAGAQPYQDAAKVYIDAANAAVTEYNKAVKDINEQMEKAAQN